MFRTQFFKSLDQNQGHIDLETVCNTLQPQDVYTHTSNIEIMPQMRYAPDMIFCVACKAWLTHRDHH